ncbi:MAG: FAD-dependent oxidoreductase [Dehalococcoidia bacterium]|nr:FAD-dependent oxidoreductase [Dehalococcoidia bacterium]
MPEGPLSAEPRRVAIVGAGPAGFYAAEALLRHAEAESGWNVEVDMFDRLCTPFGLVRHGVAPDHLKIKNVTNAFANIAGMPGFRFYGNVEYGVDITLDDLRRHYHQVIFATGAQTDRRLNIPGEDLERSHPATDFVAWYNGHPEFRDFEFDLQQESAVIVGVGNVALDVARILCLDAEELHASDMAPHAVETLSRSRVRDVYLLGRRGPAQAAFTNPELKELGGLHDTDVVIDPAEAELDPVSAEDVAEAGDRTVLRKVELIKDYAQRQPAGRSHRLHFRFLVSPTEIVDDGTGAVGGVNAVRNVLSRSETGTIVSSPTAETERIDCGLVFRSVGYRGVPLPGVPFHERWAIVPNVHGRVVDPGNGDRQVPGLYVTGWIKRGPSGVIGTNKPDAVETVSAMLEDQQAEHTLAPEDPSPAAVDALLEARGCTPVSFADWIRLDEMERQRGEEAQRPRIKFTSSDEMLEALGRA